MRGSCDREHLGEKLTGKRIFGGKINGIWNI